MIKYSRTIEQMPAAGYYLNKIGFEILELNIKALILSIYIVTVCYNVIL